jgi:hypothetical protein
MQYFWVSDGVSYSQEFVQYWTERCKRLRDYRSPYGNSAPSYHFKDIKRLLLYEEIRPDVTDTSGDTTCSLTLEEFQYPVLLSINNRTYEKVAIQEAIETILMQGQDLRLEDVTLTPMSLHKIQLFAKSGPYFSGAPRVITYPEFTGWPPFDLQRAQNGNIPEASRWFTEIPALDGSHLKLHYLWTRYSGHRRLPEPKDENYIIRDLIVENIALLPKHSKMHGGYIVFINVLFRNCTVPSTCWCGVKFISCRFENTDISKADRLNARRCQGLPRPKPRYAEYRKYKRPDGSIVCEPILSSLIPDDTGNEYDS